jgi:7-cyano-7-deazaguanine synthase in queuosine biosynthesis
MTSFFVRRSGLDSANCDFILEVGSNLITGEQDFKKNFGSVTTLEADLLLLGSSIFAADRACERGEREDTARRIDLHVPIVNLGRLQSLQSQIEFILRILSNDSWRIHFRHDAGIPEDTKEQETVKGKTLLFSGGLDSLAAAIDLGFKSDSFQLVSHKTKNRKTDIGQQTLAKALFDAGLKAEHFQFFVSSKDGGPGGLKHAEEETQRTRSFLFLILGTLVARRANHTEVVYLAENGQMAIHLPLTQGRIGSFSTHTAHPDFLASMQNFLSDALKISIHISNPYVHKTKAEVIKPVVDSFPSLIKVSQSCWRNSRLPEGIHHCGECIPCFIRRIAVETCSKTDPTVYLKDPWAHGVLHLPDDDIGRRNLVDLAEFIVRMEQLNNDDVMSEWPELYSENLDASSVINMYRRFSHEARGVLGRYSRLEALLK